MYALSVPDNADRFQRACERFFAAHAEDPRPVDVEGDGAQTASEHYHRRLGHWVQALDPQATDGVKLAAACQHIRRWTLPRGDFPTGPAGYKRWRTTLALRHAEQAEDVLRTVGYGDEMVEQVRGLLLKKGLRTDANTQLLEDAICLVFLELDFEAFAQQHGEDKTIDVLRKTWAKMTDRGHQAALELAKDLPPDLAALIGRALNP